MKISKRWTEVANVLTWGEVAARLRILSRDCDGYRLYLNMKSTYSPAPVHKIVVDTHECSYTFISEGDADEKTLGTFIGDYHFIANEQDRVFIGNSERTGSICGIYVDDTHKKIVLLNTFFDTDLVDWSSLEEKIY